MVAISADNAVEVARVTKGLLAPFADSEVKSKPAVVKGNRALVLMYIDARLVMDRLDDVVGINNWRDEYTVLPTGEVECRLTLRVAGEWLSKADVGSQSEQPDEGDRMKAAYSDALKRAAVKFGVGRYLYRLPQVWADYDPVKKQIVRPAPAKASAPDNPTLRGKRACELKGCSDATAFSSWRLRVVADRAAGQLSAADLAALNVEVAAWKAAHPEPAGAVGG